MIHLGLDTAEHERYMRALRSSHRIRLDVRIHDRDEKVLASLRRPTAHVLSGSIQYDTTADVTRSLELTLLDPERRLRFEADSPVDAAVFANRFVSVNYEVWVPDEESDLIGASRFGDGLFGEGVFGGGAAVRMKGDWVSVPVFWGPLTSFSRNGPEVTLEAQGKESLLLAPNLTIQSYMLKRSMRLDDAIRHVAAKAGERRFRLPELKQRLQGDYPVPAQTEPWKVLVGGVKLRERTQKFKAFDRGGKGKGGKKHHRDPKGHNIPTHHYLNHGLVHRAHGHQTAFYDGHGRLCVRSLPQKKCLVLQYGRDLLSVPSVDYDSLEDFRNTVIVTGRKRKIHKEAHGYVSTTETVGMRRTHGRAELPKRHPLSPHSLSRNGISRHLVEFIETELKTDAACKDRAHEILRRMSSMGVSVSFDCLPMPHLEEHDRIEIRTPEFSFEFPLTQWTLPLSADSPMSIGENRRVRKVHRRHGHHRRHPGRFRPRRHHERGHR